MTSIIKKTLITGLLFFALLPFLQAQDKYEYGQVQFAWHPGGMGKYILAVSVSGEPYEENEVPKSTLQNQKFTSSDVSPLLSKVNEFVEKGWEVFQCAPHGNGTTYYIRRKKD